MSGALPDPLTSGGASSGKGIGNFSHFSASQRNELRALYQNIRRLELELLATKNEALQLRQQVESMQSALAGAGAQIVTVPQVSYPLSSGVTMGVSDLNLLHNIVSTGTFTVTLPSALEDKWVSFFNSGAGVINISDGTNTLCTLTVNAGCDLKATRNSDGISVWPTVVPTISRDGIMTIKAVLVINDSTKGIVYKDGAGHYWQQSHLSTGALSTADLGTSLPISALSSSSL